MAQTKTKPGAKKAAPAAAKKAAAPPKSSNGNNSTVPVLSESARRKLDHDAELLERALEEALLSDAIHSAKRALDELHIETRNVPHERRSGMRLREKALRVENAFNRLRALRRGEALPPAIPEE
jgi:hypothetical protein